jgi:hypothetical protein
LLICLTFKAIFLAQFLHFYTIGTKHEEFADKHYNHLSEPASGG